jgi:hypothetical protein
MRASSARQSAKEIVMRKLLTFLVALGVALLPSIGALAWYQSIQQVGVPTAPTSSYVHQCQATDAGTSSSTVTFSCNTGTATATRVILVGTARQGSSQYSGVTVNGLALTLVTGTDSHAAHATAFWAGVGASFGSGSQTVILSGGAFELRGAQVWTMDGLSSTSAKNASITTSITTAVGDFLFRADSTNSASESYSTSTEAPANTYNNSAGFQWGADWKIAATAGTFTVNIVPPTGNAQSTVSFH